MSNLDDGQIKPDYYSGNGMKVWDVTDAFECDFCSGNAIKYILRAGKKGDKVEDLRKAMTYIKHLIEIEESKVGQHIPPRDAGLPSPAEAGHTINVRE